MTCYHPLKGYRSKTTNKKTGKRNIVFNKKQGYVDLPVEVPCGQCIGCRLGRSRMWATRVVHEASLYEDNVFLTLTYDEENIPKSGSLVKEDFQKFIKRLREDRDNSPKRGDFYFTDWQRKIRYFQCGEYGEKFQRPHYHAVIFNLDFADKIFYKQTNTKNKLYISERLNEIWGLGYCIIGNVTFESAAYVARYVTKKITGKKAWEHYSEIDKATGEITSERVPEYITMSRRPGIGRGWYEMYQDDVFPSDEVVIAGKRLKVPRYYDNLLEIEDPKQIEEIKYVRQLNAKNCSDNNSGSRLRVREAIQKKKLEQLTRGYENQP